MGIINFTIFSGKEPFTASLSPAVLPAMTGLSYGSYSFVGVPMGVYTLTITDDNGCIYEIEDLTYPFTCSSTNIFRYAHSSIVVNNQIFLGERRQNPNIVVFTDPDDLTQYQTINIPDVGSVNEGLETVCYSSITGKLYFSCRDNNTGLLGIVELDPNSLLYTKHVIAAPIFGNLAVIDTDGTYIYGGNGSHFFKIRIFDWSVIQTKVYDSGFNTAHSIIVNASRNQFYVSSYQEISMLAIVSTTDLSNVTYIDLTPYVSHPTDDMACYDNGTLCKVYIVGEYPIGSYGAASVEITAGNAVQGIALLPSYSIESNEDVIYSAAISGKLQWFNIATPASKTTYSLEAGFIPNELIFVNNRLFITKWAGLGIAKLCEFGCF